MSYDFRGYNPCHHQEKCFQDNVTCSTTSICMGEKCYYGNSCQLTTEGFSLSLDVVFGYHIKPFVSFVKQSKVVTRTALLTIIMLVTDFISGLLSALTFPNHSLTELGCGIYLLSISVISLLTICSYIHGPISRQLFDEKDEERTWCIVEYSSKLKIYDIFGNLFHFLMAFVINLLSSLIIIIQAARIRSKIGKKASHKPFLYGQIKRHKHILISPCILIVLASSRLAITLLSRCVESVRDPWLFIADYYISFAPSLLIFVVFVLPSEKYKEQFFIALRKTDLIPRQQ